MARSSSILTGLGDEEARTLIRGMLYKYAGSVVLAADAIGCSITNLWHWVRKLDMLDEPRLYREMAKNRFRLTSNTA